MVVDHLLKTKKEFKNAKKQEIQRIFIKTNEIKLAFNMTWLMEILRIYQEIFNIAKNPNYDGNQQGLASKIHKMFVENTSVSSGGPFTHARSETLAFEAMLFKTKLFKTKN